MTPKGPLAGDRGHGHFTCCRAASDTAGELLVGAITTRSPSAPSQTPNHLLSAQTAQPENRETSSQRDSSCTAVLRPGSKVPTCVPEGQSRGCLELPCKALQGQETREVLLTQRVNGQERMQVPGMGIVGSGGAEQSASG